jgi:hypothetical protein
MVSMLRSAYVMPEAVANWLVAAAATKKLTRHWTNVFHFTFSSIRVDGEGT